MSDYYCHAREVDEEKIEDELLESCIFSIDVHASFTYSNRDDNDELNLRSYIDSFQSVTIRRTHQVQQDHIYRDPQSTIHGVIDSMHVPTESFMIDEISACATRMLKDDYYRNRKVLRICVNIDVMVAELPFPLDDENPTPIPASKAAIEGLAKTIVENPVDCAICLDGLLTSSEAKMMPCSHVFHADYIVNWLRKSKSCPTCRFELPS